MAKFDVENPVMEMIGRIGDYILLNVAYLLTSLPVLTIGMTTTALYKVLMREQRKEPVRYLRDYFAECRQEWRKATLLWLPLLAAGAVLVLDIVFISQAMAISQVVAGCLLVVWLFVASYAFPLQARFENSLGNTLKNALLMSLRHLPYTLAIVAVNLLPVLCSWIGGGVLVWGAFIFFFLGFVAMARINAFLFWRIFRGYDDTEEQ